MISLINHLSPTAAQLFQMVFGSGVVLTMMKTIGWVALGVNVESQTLG
jgi:hypothetical protein